MARVSRPQATVAERDEFECFLFEMDDVLELFVTEAHQAGFRLDYSLESLHALEQFLASNARGTNDSQMLNRTARYLGEVFRKNVGGKWELCLKDPQYLYFKLPVITGYARVSIEFCPIEIVSSFLRNREPGLLTGSVNSHLEFKQ